MHKEVQTTEVVPEQSQVPVSTPEDVPAVEVEESEKSEEQKSSKEEARQSEQPRPSKNERIIKEVTRSRDDWKETAEKWYRRAQELEAEYRKASNPAPNVSQIPPKPKQSDFENYDDFVEALTEWKVEVKVKTELNEALRDREAKEKEARERAELENAAKIHQRKLEEARRKYEEVDEIMRDRSFPISHNMVQAIFDSDNSPEILQYLAHHREESEKIYRMTPLGAVRAIGKIERDIEVAKNTPKPKTKAPDPITPIAGTGGGSALLKKEEDMSTEEYIAYRNKLEFGK